MYTTHKKVAFQNINGVCFNSMILIINSAHSCILCL